MVIEGGETVAGGGETVSEETCSISAHRVIVAARCDWFRRALLSGMREAIDRSVLFNVWLFDKNLIYYYISYQNLLVVTPKLSIFSVLHSPVYIDLPVCVWMLNITQRESIAATDCAKTCHSSKSQNMRLIQIFWPKIKYLTLDKSPYQVIVTIRSNFII